MTSGYDKPIEAPAQGHLLMLACIAPIAGAAVGLVGALFMLSLEAAVKLRGTLVGAAQAHGTLGLIMVIAGSALAVGFSAWLVQRFSPFANGSGIPHVEAVIAEEMPPAPPSLLVVKFIGGVTAIGAGLALGREGPSVQMGAGIAHSIGKLFRRSWSDCRVLMAAGAGAGLGTAFNAPISGGVFVLEELVRRFEPRIAIVVLGASASAISVARVLMGDAPDFHIGPVDAGNPATLLLFVLLGLIAGGAGIVYNRSILWTMALAQRMHMLPVEVRAALIGAAVGALGWYMPDLIGGGDNITQSTLLGQQALMMIPLLLLARLALGAVSYAAGTPGGLFAPLLALGALLGLGVGLLLKMGLPWMAIQPEAFAVVGMAALFAGAVRAPLTGIVLVTEMTASVELLLPLLGACFAAMLVPTLTGNPPIYDSLRESTLARQAGPARK